MSPLAIGPTAVTKAYIGSTAVVRAYLGSNLVFGEAPAAPATYTTWTRKSTEDFDISVGGTVWGMAGHPSLAYLYFPRQFATLASAVRRSDRMYVSTANVTIPNKDWRGGVADASNLYLCGNGNTGEIWKIPLDGSDASTITPAGGAGLSNANAVFLAGSVIHICDHNLPGDMNEKQTRAYSLTGTRMAGADIRLQGGMWDATSDGVHVWAAGPGGCQAFTVAGNRASSVDIGSGQYYGCEAVGNRFYGQRGAGSANVHVWEGTS